MHVSVCLPSRTTGTELVRTFLSFAWLWGVFNHCQVHSLGFESTTEKLGEVEATKVYPCGHGGLVGLPSHKAN